MARQSQHDVLNKIRLALLDWDPMHLFDMGMGGLEEYDEFIPLIAKKMKKTDDIEELTSFLLDLAENKMDDADTSLEEAKVVAEKLSHITLS
jgi:hypothetical protein